MKKQVLFTFMIGGAMGCAASAAAVQITPLNDLSANLDTSPALYAVNLTRTAAVRTVNGLAFQPYDGVTLTVPGISVDYLRLDDPWGTAPNTDSADLNAIMHDIAYDFRGSDRSVNVQAAVASGLYELTLLFSENFHGDNRRTFDVTFEDGTLVDDFRIFDAAGGQSEVVAMAYEAAVNDGTLNVDLTIGGSGDVNPILAGFIVRVVPEPGSLALLGLSGLCVLRRRRT